MKNKHNWVNETIEHCRRIVPVSFRYFRVQSGAVWDAIQANVKHNAEVFKKWEEFRKAAGFSSRTRMYADQTLIGFEVSKTGAIIPQGWMVTSSGNCGPRIFIPDKRTPIGKMFNNGMNRLPHKVLLTKGLAAVGVPELTPFQQSTRSLLTLICSPDIRSYAYIVLPWRNYTSAAKLLAVETKGYKPNDEMKFILNWTPVNGMAEITEHQFVLATSPLIGKPKKVTT